MEFWVFTELAGLRLSHEYVPPSAYDSSSCHALHLLSGSVEPSGQHLLFRGRGLPLWPFTDIENRPSALRRQRGWIGKLPGNAAQALPFHAG